MRLALILMLLLAAPRAVAAGGPPPVPLRDYVHTVWTQTDGAPLGAIGMVFQTSDGYLWLIAREAGLLRFDGMRFVRPSTPCRQRVTTAARAPDGGFWAICGDQLIRLTARGQFVEVPQTFLPLDASIAPELIVDRLGRPWFIRESIRYLEPDGTGGRERARPTALPITAVTQDVDGTLWASDQQQVVHIYDDHHEAIALRSVLCLFSAHDGGIFATNTEQVWRLRAGLTPSPIDVPPAIGLSNLHRSLSETADGGLWLGTRQQGVALLQNGRVETVSDGREVRTVLTVFVDREGTIWAGATSGLHRFRKPMVQVMRAVSSHLAGVPNFVFSDSHDGLWFAPGIGGGVSRIGSDGGIAQTVAGRFYRASGEDRLGRIWLSDDRDIGYVADGRFVRVRDAAHVSVRGVYAFSQDARGDLWAVADGVGVYRVMPGPPRLVIESPRAASRFLVSARSGIWVGIRSGVEQHIDGRTNVFPDNSPIRADGIPWAIVEDGDSMWIGTFRGLRRWRHGQWTMWTREHGLPGDGVVEDIVADRFGRFWIMSGGGLLMVPRAQLDATPDGAPRTLTFARIGLLDGLVPHQGGMRSSPRLIADRRGRLYFTTLDSVMTIDPAAVTESSLAPPIVLESATIDNRQVDVTTNQRFIEPARLQFDFTSLSLRSPENARFRYQLQGYDPDWIDAGGQRHVTYGTLRSGLYRFRVIGAASEGVWNEEGASFTFHIASAYYHTTWFAALVLFGSIGVVWSTHRVRLRIVERHRGEISALNEQLMKAQEQERMRLAGELHDGVMQEMLAVTMLVGTARRRIPAESHAKATLDKIEEKMVRVGADIRRLSHDLHPPLLQEAGLPGAVRAYSEEFSTASGIPVSCEVEDSTRDLSRGAALALFRVVQEALGNAAKYAKATAISVRLTRSNTTVSLLVSDNGVGFDRNRAASGGLGLIMMRERASQLNGTFDIDSAPGRGTIIRVAIPFR
jgi:signal transduction histidine kinase/ligand-binding sensor domain-containing protein